MGRRLWLFRSHRDTGGNSHPGLHRRRVVFSRQRNWSPELPSRPSAMGSTSNALSSPMGSSMNSGYGGMNSGYGGMGSSYGSGYGSSYGMGSSYGSGYGSGLGGYGSYGGMGGMGGMYGSRYGGYGSYGGMGIRRIRRYGWRTHGSERSGRRYPGHIQLIESIVGAVGGFAQMLESTYMATQSSFFAMVSVAEQFGNLKNTLGSLLGIYAIMRWARRLVAKLSGQPVTGANGITPAGFAKFEATGGAAGPGRVPGPRTSRCSSS